MCVQFRPAATLPSSGSGVHLFAISPWAPGASPNHRLLPENINIYLSNPAWPLKIVPWTFASQKAREMLSPLTWFTALFLSHFSKSIPHVTFHSTWYPPELRLCLLILLFLASLLPSNLTFEILPGFPSTISWLNSPSCFSDLKSSLPSHLAPESPVSS